MYLIVCADCGKQTPAFYVENTDKWLCYSCIPVGEQYTEAPDECSYCQKKKFLGYLNDRKEKNWICATCFKGQEFSIDALSLPSREVISAEFLPIVLTQEQRNAMRGVVFSTNDDEYIGRSIIESQSRIMCVYAKTNITYDEAKKQLIKIVAEVSGNWSESMNKWQLIGHYITSCNDHIALVIVFKDEKFKDFLEESKTEIPWVDETWVSPKKVALYDWVREYCVFIDDDLAIPPIGGRSKNSKIQITTGKLIE